MRTRCLLLAPSHLTVTRALKPAGKRQGQDATVVAFGSYDMPGNGASSSEPLVT